MALDDLRRDAAHGVGDAAGSSAMEVSPDALKIFISYSRADLEAADRMVAALTRQGFAVKIDVRDLPYGEEWQAELADFIAESDTVVWLVSPDSIRSKWVNWELGEVGRLSKRLVPVRVRAVEAGSLPEALGRINLLPNRGVYDPAEHEAALVAALNANRGWLKKGTSLSEAAREWIKSERNGAHLLRGRALAEAGQWSQTPPRDAPSPPSDVLELILASRRAEQRRRRVGWSLAAAVAAGLAGLGWFGQMQAQNAEEQRQVARATSAQRQNEIARKLLEGQTQMGAAIAGLSATVATEAPVMGRLQRAWADRLVPVRDAIRTEKPQLWQIAGKQVVTAGERLATYPDGIVIGFAALSETEFMLVDAVGRIVVLDAKGDVRRSYQWNTILDADTLGSSIPTLRSFADGDDPYIGGFSRLSLYKTGDHALVLVGRIEATTAGGEMPRILYVDLKNDIARFDALSYSGPQPLKGDPACAGFVAVDGNLALLDALYRDKGIASPFKAVSIEPGEDEIGNIVDRAEALCLVGEYSANGVLRPALSVGVDFDFIAPAGKVPTLPVLKPEETLWRPAGDEGLWRDEWYDQGSRGIMPLDGAFSIDFLPEEEFYERAMFRGNGDANGFSYARAIVEQKRFEGDIQSLPPDLKLFRRGGKPVMAGAFYDKWMYPEVCWFDDAYVVEACVGLGVNFENGGGFYLSADGAFAVGATMEGLGNASLTLVDIDRRKVRVPQQRSGGTVLDLFMHDGKLLAVDNRGVVWVYSFPDMELISSFDMKWPGSWAKSLAIGGRYLDFSSPGVVRLLDAGTQETAWISAPFPGSETLDGVAVSSDESVVMVRGGSGAVRVLDSATGMPLTSAFRPDQVCSEVEHDQGILELKCNDGNLRRLIPAATASMGVADVGAFALDSQEAAAAFFVGLSSIDLGPIENGTETDVAPIAGTVEEFIEANRKPAADAQEDAPVEEASAEPPLTDLGWPVEAPVAAAFRQGGGDGVDFAVAEGTPVSAAEGGTVIHTGADLGALGNIVLIRHREGIVTVYAHLSRIDVARDQTVTRGQAIGLSGMSGAAEVPKLHFEVRRDANPVDPALFLSTAFEEATSDTNRGPLGLRGPPSVR